MNLWAGEAVGYLQESAADGDDTGGTGVADLVAETANAKRDDGDQLGAMAAHLQQGAVGFLIGRTSGPKVGFFNGLKTDCRVTWKTADGVEKVTVSTELTIVSPLGTRAPELSAPGDSGSPVFEARGGAVGMLRGGDREPEDRVVRQQAAAVCGRCHVTHAAEAAAQNEAITNPV
jgi:hypothetical protein